MPGYRHDMGWIPADMIRAITREFGGTATDGHGVRLDADNLRATAANWGIDPDSLPQRLIVTPAGGIDGYYASPPLAGQLRAARRFMRIICNGYGGDAPR